MSARQEPLALVLYEAGEDRPSSIVDLQTGELVSIDSDDDDLIGLRLRANDLINSLRTLNRAIDNELRSRMDKDAHWTRHAPTLRIKASSTSPAPKLTVLRPQELWDLLAGMVKAGEITDAAMHAAIEQKPTEYSVKIAGVKRLMTRVDLVERLQTVATEVEPDRPVKYGPG